MFIVSFAAVIHHVYQVSVRQRLCADRPLGRMYSTVRFVVWGILPIGALIGLLGSPMRSMREFARLGPTTAVTAATRPIGAVERLGEVIAVNLTKREIEDLPAVDLAGSGA